MMEPKQQEDFGKRRVSTTVVRNELRLQKWGLGCERSSRLPAHPLEYDDRGFPIDQPPLTAAGRLASIRQ
jgi:hypothetical protein